MSVVIRTLKSAGRITRASISGRAENPRGRGIRWKSGESVPGVSWIWGSQNIHQRRKFGQLVADLGGKAV